MNSVELLLILRDITHKHKESVQSAIAYVKTLLKWTLTYQSKDQSNTKYYTLFLSRIDIIRSHGGKPGFHREAFWKDLTKLLEKKGKTRVEFSAMGTTGLFHAKKKAWYKTARESVCNELLSCMFIHNLDSNRYEQLKKDQHSSYLVGKSIYTDTLINFKKLLEERKGGRKGWLNSNKHSSNQGRSQV